MDELKDLEALWHAEQMQFWFCREKKVSYFNERCYKKDYKVGRTIHFCRTEQ